MPSGMDKNSSFQFKLIEGVPNKESLKTLLDLYSSIFKDARIDFFKQRLTIKENVLSIIASEDQKPIGFKVGYRYDETTFYSWVGGTLEDFRKRGIAQHLAELQQNWVKNKGYSKLRTKSMNRFKPMMILNLKNGFEIIKVYTNKSGQTKIIFEKNLVSAENGSSTS